VSSFAQFRDAQRVKELVRMLHRVYPGGTLKIMEVCGTHTMAIARFGLRDLMPGGLSLISGPGCPVCVTPSSVILSAIALTDLPGVVLVTFGDMMRVPAGVGHDAAKTLEKRKAEGADIRVVYSVLDILEMAEREPDRRFVFISVGFETTTPGTALTILEAERRKLDNVFFLLSNRKVIPALHALASSQDIRIQGFLCPGHVSVIIGYDAYREIADRYTMPCVVAGFEPVDILMAVTDIVTRVANGSGGVGNSYGRAVTEKGNLRAQQVMDRVFKVVDGEWRGIGVIPLSGLGFRTAYERFDAFRTFLSGSQSSFSQPVEAQEPLGCRCGDVLKGIIIPTECALFGKRCTPTSPVGPCMVSSEGSCAAYYKYGA
jgi:hydrogenase expression/formation protein HypD